jgi:hypothetical protein
VAGSESHNLLVEVTVVAVSSSFRVIQKDRSVSIYQGQVLEYGRVLPSQEDSNRFFAFVSAMDDAAMWKYILEEAS